MESSRLFSTRLLAACLALVVGLIGLAPATGLAQKEDFGFGGFGFPSVDQAGPKVSYSASYELSEDGKSGQLTVSAEVVLGFHTYSTTQPDGGPLKTTIDVASDQIKLTGPFAPDRSPHIAMDDIYPGIPVEEYDGRVSWTAPFEVIKHIDPASTKLAVAVNGLVCGNGSCEPVGEKLQASFSAHYAVQQLATTFRHKNTHAEWSAELSAESVAPGDVAYLTVTVRTDPNYHIYRYVPGDPESGYRTLFVATKKSGLKFGEPATTAEQASLGELLGQEVKYYRDTQVQFEIPITVPSNNELGTYPIELKIAFFTCNDNSCDPPAAVLVSGQVNVSESSEKNPLALGIAATDRSTVLEHPQLASWIDDDAAGGGTDSPPPLLATASDEDQQLAAAPLQSLTITHLFAALAGGFILNFMPCVLPVIGLKVLSFADQAGNDRGRVISLNLAYVAGIVFVMLVLALITVIAKIAFGTAFGWGQQFTVLEFKVVLAVLVFAMSLSFLGVWEIPIPGFAMSSKSGELMEKEGLLGAFTKGILTTVLATPCSGPLLGSLFGLSLTLSPVNVIVLYTVVGLGMSLPYLILCIYPGFIKVLPKPGPWMETFKQLLAFPLLLTVVFFVASIDSDHRVATLTLLMVVWFACWLVGKVPAYAAKEKRMAAWGTAIAVTALGAFISFKYFGPIEHNLPWVDYDETHLTQLRNEGKTVMVDFTANWCWNCQVNMRVAIDRVNVAKLVAANDVVPMVADWTDHSEEIHVKLNELGSNSIPLLAIFPPGPDSEPIVLRDLLTESQVLEALEQAGPSQGKATYTSSLIQ